MREFVASIDGLPKAAKADLAQLTPATYTGNAAAQAHDIDSWLAALR
jgi:adenylosuccinate lyase